MSRPCKLRRVVFIKRGSMTDKDLDAMRSCGDLLPVEIDSLGDVSCNGDHASLIAAAQGRAALRIIDWVTEGKSRGQFQREYILAHFARVLRKELSG